MSSVPEPTLKRSGWNPLRWTYLISLLWIASVALGTIVGVVSTLASESGIAVRIPVGHYFSPGDIYMENPEHSGAQILSGGFTQAEVSISGLDMAARLWIAGGFLVQGVTFILIGIAIASLCSRVISGAPFHAAMTRTVRVTAIAIAAGGMAWQVLSAVGSTMAAQQTLASVTWTFPGDVSPVDGSRYLGPPIPAGLSTIELWPVWVGIALFVLAAAFQYGDKLQRETERLRRDTTGLI
ncbi:MAG TPA: hypothetical protein VGP24_18110 [Glaciihabitans sp.]|jgi:hypothetical protein|nr:hypothetical protein [Glaciihabitans sp.]